MLEGREIKSRARGTQFLFACLFFKTYLAPSHRFQRIAQDSDLPKLTMSTSSTPKVFLVTGANRGVGLTTARALVASDPTIFLIATARNPAAAKDLLALAHEYEGRVHVQQLETTEVGSVKVCPSSLPSGLIDILMTWPSCSCF